MNASKLLSQNRLPIKGEFVFIDLETTGLRPNIDKIIEIGLYYILDGVVQYKWDSLINPGIAIPTHIQQLTGITNEMVKNSPCFADIAIELNKMLQNKIFVAHNARFDYSFLKDEFKKCNISFEEKILCMVRLSRIFFPELQDHSLRAIQQRLDLKHIQRHRALADVEIMFHFFDSLQAIASEADLHKVINLSIKSQPISSLSTLHHLENIPNSSGIYRFYGEDDALLYIGNSISLRDKIMSHFKMDYNQFNAIQLSQQIKKIDWIETAGKFGALLLESNLIKNNIPIFNRILRKSKKLFTIKLMTNKNSFLCLKVEKLSNITTSEVKDTFGVFKSLSVAENILKSFIKDNELCFHVNNFEKGQQACFRYQIEKCKGACGNHEAANDYNERVNMALPILGASPWPYENKIAIKETDAQDPEKFDFHIIDRWCYLGSVKSLDDCIENNVVDTKVDIEIYHILSGFQAKKQNQIEIIELN